MPMYSPWAQWGYKADKSRPVGEGGLSGTVEGGISRLSLCAIAASCWHWPSSKGLHGSPFKNHLLHVSKVLKPT